MKTIYQVVTADINNDVTRVKSDVLFATKELAIQDIEKKMKICLKLSGITVEDWNRNPWQSCKIKQGLRGETWRTYEVIKVIKNSVTGEETRVGIINHELYGL